MKYALITLLYILSLPMVAQGAFFLEDGDLPKVTTHIMPEGREWLTPDVVQWEEQVDTIPVTLPKVSLLRTDRRPILSPINPE
ncbi:hypothetical protein LEM8419_03539 [Neolewinella maritima]|uniref:Uncharacterized protein n=1 Tax=Neolewinella maritima TaxID=1383882 RepID=A0ABN8F6S8_9BACT|nr:hypothetical protein [Neolewinella maritima]CAH1002667.1 hypothetical protein LEM8419_03539 [Neolewinella maritima]